MLIIKYCAIFLIGQFSIIILTRHFNSAADIYPQFLFLTTVFYMLILVLIMAQKFIKKKKVEKILISAIISFLLSYSFMITFPVLADRSITIHMLAYMESRSKSEITVTELTTNFNEEYVREEFQIQRRLSEQINLNNVTERVCMNNENQASRCYTLTNRGKIFVKFNRALANIFNLDPNYTDRVSNN